METVCEEEEGEGKILVKGRSSGHPQCHWDGGRRGHRRSVKVNHWSRTPHQQREKSIRGLWAAAKPPSSPGPVDKLISAIWRADCDGDEERVLPPLLSWDYLSDLLSNWEANLSRSYPGHISPTPQKRNENFSQSLYAFILSKGKINLKWI